MSGPVYVFMFRRDPAAEWTVHNPVLRLGEPGYETDTRKFKIGDGFSVWSSLPYFQDQEDTAVQITTAIDEAVLEGVPGKSAYEVAVENGFIGTEEEWLESLVGPAGANGTNGVDGDDGAPGLPGPAGETYPLSASGFVSSSINLTDATTSSTAGPWVIRLWVPPNTAFSKVGCFVSAVGAAGNTLNAFALYDAAGNLVAQTPNNNNLWTAGGWTMQDFPSTIAAQSTGRFVFIAIAMNGSDPSLLYHQANTNAVFNGIVSGHRRSWLGPSRNAGFPASFNVATEGTEFPYIPLIVLAV